MRRAVRLTTHRATLKYDTAAVTASWKFEGGAHVISMGEAFRDSVNTGAETDDRQMKDYAAALIRHEAAHGCYSERNLAATAAACVKAGVPFRLLNLFEDARIEHRDRTDVTPAGAKVTVAERFNWDRWTANPADTNDPATLFWSLVNREASSWSSYNVAAAKWTGSPDDRRAVTSFYDRAIKAENTGALIPLCQEWVKRFPPPPKSLPRGSSSIGGQEDPTSGTGGGLGYAPPAEGRMKDPEPLKGTPEIEHGPVTPTVDETRELAYFNADAGYPDSAIQSKYRPVDGNRVRLLTQRLAGVVRAAGHAPLRTSCGGSRLHMPGVMVGAERSFRQTKQSDGRRQLTVIFDFSGSMTGARRAGDQMEFMLALMQLHRKGILHCNLWLSGEGRCLKVNAGWGWSAIKRLMPQRGSESIKATMQNRNVRADMDASSLTVVYTDGCLTDGDVDANHWRGLGIDVVGAVTLKEPDETARQHIRNEMAKHFGRYFACNTAHQLATELVNYIARKK